MPKDFNYFEKFFSPIKYGGHYGRDLTRLFSFVDAGLDENILETYDIKDGDTLQSISMDKYGSQDYWFVVALVNHIEDPFYDFPRTIQSLYQHVLKINGGVYDNKIYERILSENKSKMRIKLVKNEYLNQFTSDLAGSFK